MSVYSIYAYEPEISEDHNWFLEMTPEEAAELEKRLERIGLAGPAGDPFITDYGIRLMEEDPDARAEFEEWIDTIEDEVEDYERTSVPAGD